MQACLKLKKMMNAGKLRKQAFLEMRIYLQSRGMAFSARSIYAWAKRFKIDLK